MQMQSLVNFFSIMANLALILSLPIALYQIIRALRIEQREREQQVYNALDDKYIEFMSLCLQHSYLDIFDIPDKEPVVLTPKQKKEELIAFTMLISIFERAYLMYHDQNNRMIKIQWMGWDEYIREYCKRENFQYAWTLMGGTFDRRFEQYMSESIK
jgi:hypothetical protein